MKIEHVALFTNQLEKMKAFYGKYFDFQHGDRYHNTKTSFESYFLSQVEDQNATRLELMTRSNPELKHPSDRKDEITGWSHLAISVGSEKLVVELTKTLANDGYCVISQPRRTGDGYYESCVLDPDGNKLELTV